MFNTLRKNNNICVIGDVILDNYINLDYLYNREGVPIYSITDSTKILGGAGNVLNQLITAEQNVVLITKLGTDESASHLTEIINNKIFHKENIMIYYDSDIKTTTKYYLDLGLRLEVNDCVSSTLFDDFILDSVKNLDLNTIDAVIFSDYCKGVFDINPDVLKNIINLFIKNNIPIFVDTKRNDIKIFDGCSFFKSNLIEFCNQGNIVIEDYNQKHIEKISKSFNIKNWIVTMSDKGVVALIDNTFYKLNTVVNAAESPIGAGDTFLAYTVIAYLANLTMSNILEVANSAAAVQVENRGTYTVSIDEVERKYNDSYGSYKRT